MMGLVLHAWEKEAKASGKQLCLPFPGLLSIQRESSLGPSLLRLFNKQDTVLICP